MTARECIHDDNPTATPDDDLCASCLAVERAGEALPNRRRHDRRQRNGGPDE